MQTLTLSLCHTIRDKQGTLAYGTEAGALTTHSNLMPRLKKNESYTSTPYLTLHDLLQDAGPSGHTV